VLDPSSAAELLTMFPPEKKNHAPPMPHAQSHEYMPQSYAKHHQSAFTAPLRPGS
jgi:hypothetical protein